MHGEIEQLKKQIELLLKAKGEMETVDIQLCGGPCDGQRLQVDIGRPRIYLPTMEKVNLFTFEREPPYDMNFRKYIYEKMPGSPVKYKYVGIEWK